jgi:hypothetical protein
LREVEVREISFLDRFDTERVERTSWHVGAEEIADIEALVQRTEQVLAVVRSVVDRLSAAAILEFEFDDVARFERGHHGIRRGEPNH